MIVSLISGTPESVNQENIKVNTTIAPIFMLFSSVIFAPIVEESVFRGGIFYTVEIYGICSFGNY